MRTLIYLGLFLAVVLVNACTDDVQPNDPNNPNPNSGSFSYSGRWENGGNQANSWRAHHFAFDVTDFNAVLDLSLETDNVNTNGYLWIKYPNGQNSGRLISSRGTEGLRNDFTLSDTGTHYVVIGTDNFDVGNYSFSMTGTDIRNIRKVEPTFQSINDRWEPGGGSEHFSRRNHLYSFTTTEFNTYLDVTVETPNVANKAAVSIVNESNESIFIRARNYFNSNYSTPPVLIEEPGTYTLSVLGENEEISDYNLQFFADPSTSNLTKVPFNSLTANDTIQAALPHTHEYIFDVTEASSHFDIGIKTMDINEFSRFRLFDNDTGEIILSVFGSNNYYHTLYSTFPKTYRLEIYNFNSLILSGYELQINGEVANLQRL